MTSILDLGKQAEKFARDLSDAVSAFANRSVPFEASQSGTRFVVTDSGGTGVPLTIGGIERLSLEVTYRCQWDAQSRYLAVHSSKVAVYAGARPKGDPLFRFEYVRDQASDLPTAHIHLHAHRDQFTHVMALAGQAGLPRRRPNPGSEFEGARMCNVHFPVGGHRFRPGLEDVLEFARVELGAEAGPHWTATLQRTREGWRRSQTAAVVRDCPSEAVRVLIELGYDVHPPVDGAPSDNLSRLIAY